MSTRLASALWLGWVVVLAAITGSVLKWHLDYFSSPGPEFHRLALVFMPGLALFACGYAILRRKKIFQYEPSALAALICGACLFYEPRASLVTAALFFAWSAAGRRALRGLGMKLDHPIDRIALGFGAGMGMLIPILFLLGLARWFYPAVFLAVIILPGLAFSKEMAAVLHDLRDALVSWGASPAVRHPVAGVAVVFGSVAAVCALMVMLAPSIAFDSVALHLPAVEYYAAHHALTPVPGLDYSYYPQGMEVLWTLVYSLAGQAGARLLCGLFFLAFLLMLFRIGRACGADGGAAMTGVVFAGTLPFLHWTGSVVKNDLGLAFFQALSLYAFLRWLETGSFRTVIIGVFFLAEAFEVKLTALFGAVPLAMLFAYAVWHQRPRWKAAAAVVAVGLAFGTGWAIRNYVLVGNPVYPDEIGIVGQGALEVTDHSTGSKLRHYAKIPWTVLFDGRDAFESPLPNPAGIVFFAFAPLALLAGRFRPGSLTQAQIATAVFAGANLLLWAWFLTKVRYAILPFGLLAMCMAVWVKRFYETIVETGGARVVRASVLGVEIYCLLIALMGLMIVGINGPQLAYFSRRVDASGYLRTSMRAYGAVEFLNSTGGEHPRIFGVEDVARAYATDPPDFDGLVCESARKCRAERVFGLVRKHRTEFLILPDGNLDNNPDNNPDNKMDWKDLLERLGSPARVYRDDYFTVYDLRKATPR